MTCSFCKSQDVVLSSGHKYCANHIHLIEEPVIISWILELDIPIHKRIIVRTVHEMFDSKELTFSLIPKLYHIVPRGQWLDDKLRFQIPQKLYVQKCFLVYAMDHLKSVDCNIFAEHLEKIDKLIAQHMEGNDALSI